MAESVLGTFRVDKELWNNFQGLAKGSSGNASQAIVGFIQACIDGNIDIKNYTNIKPKPKPEVDNLDDVIDAYLDKNLDTCIHSYLDKNLDQLKFEVAILSDSNQKTLLELSYQRGDIESLKTSAASTSDIPTLETIKTEIEQSIAPIENSIGELEAYIPSQFAAVRDEIKKALGDRAVTPDPIATDSSSKPASSVITEASPVVENSAVVHTPDPIDTAATPEPEHIRFGQLAKQIGYIIPDGVKPANPRIEGADGLIAFAASLGQSYKWDGNKQRLYRIEV